MAEAPVDGLEEVGMLLEVQRIQKVRLPETGKWLIRSAGSPDAPSTDKYAAWNRYAFVVRQKIRQDRLADPPTIMTTLLIRSSFLRVDLSETMKQLDHVAWHAPILKLDPLLILNFLPRLSELAVRLCDLDEKDSSRKQHLTFFIEFLSSEYANTIQKINNFVKHCEITFDFIWAIFTPGDILFSVCDKTGEPRAYRLNRMVRRPRGNLGEDPYWLLTCEYVEALTPSSSGHGFHVIFATEEIKLQYFSGVKQIVQLAAYPGHFHSGSEQVQNRLTERGRRWMALCGRHHKEYTGIAWKEPTIVRAHTERVQVSGRIMIDRVTFIAVNPNYGMPSTRTSTRSGDIKRDIIEELFRFRPPAVTVPREDFFPSSLKSEGESLAESELLLTTPIVYGFSFTDKRWLEFNVDQITDIQWNAEAFSNLAIDPTRKILVQSLVESHNSADTSLDDFVRGKGLGLVINLFGPPGVGKTFTVEATSEHLKRPLYVVSAGDLGTKPSELDHELTKIFSFVHIWNAVVLIDEADVFLEARSTADIQRNAMVAVFLRQLEYFQGILFLTTNRIKNYDLAFQSRIHFSLHYSKLSQDAKEQLWRAFLKKSQSPELCDADFKELARKNLNGRQIKNAVKLAAAVAKHEQKLVTYEHILTTMRATDDWESKAITGFEWFKQLVSRRRTA